MELEIPRKFLSFSCIFYTKNALIKLYAVHILFRHPTMRDSHVIIFITSITHVGFVFYNGVLFFMGVVNLVCSSFGGYIP